MKPPKILLILSLCAFLGSYSGLQVYSYYQEEKITDLIKQNDMLRVLHFRDSLVTISLADSLKKKGLQSSSNKTEVETRSEILYKVGQEVSAQYAKYSEANTFIPIDVDIHLPLIDTEVLLAPKPASNDSAQTASNDVKPPRKKVNRINLYWVYFSQNNFLFKGNIDYPDSFWVRQCNEAGIKNYQELSASGFKFTLTLMHYNNAKWNSYLSRHKSITQIRDEHLGLLRLWECDSIKTQRDFYIVNINKSDFQDALLFTAELYSNKVKFKLDNNFSPLKSHFKVQ